MLRSEAPQLRTEQALLKKNEEIVDGLERGAITPKTAEQMSQCIKTPISLARLRISYLKMMASFGRKMPIPQAGLLRSLLDLPEKVSPSDGETVRALIGEK